MEPLVTLKGVPFLPREIKASRLDFSGQFLQFYCGSHNESRVRFFGRTKPGFDAQVDFRHDGGTFESSEPTAASHCK